MSAAVPRRGRDRRRRDAEPRHDRRQHRQRVARRRHAAGAARLRRRARAGLGARRPARAVRSASIAATRRWISRRTSSSQSIRLPRGRGGWLQAYRKVGTRRAQAISKVCFAAAIDLTGARRARHPDRARQRGADRRARVARRGRDPRPRARPTRRSPPAAMRSRATSPRSTICARPPSIACASRAICWRSSCRQRSRDSGPRYRGSNPCLRVTRCPCVSNAQRPPVPKVTAVTAGSDDQGRPTSALRPPITLR